MLHSKTSNDKEIIYEYVIDELRRISKEAIVLTFWGGAWWANKLKISVRVLDLRAEIPIPDLRITGKSIYHCVVIFICSLPYTRKDRSLWNSLQNYRKLAGAGHSSVGIATDYGLDYCGSLPGTGNSFLHSFETSLIGDFPWGKAVGAWICALASI
jgi:hypothetical protein